jgi:hypothetical protein
MHNAHLTASSFTNKLRVLYFVKPREAASRGKTLEMDTCLAPALASYGGSRRRAYASRFSDVLKGVPVLTLTGLPRVFYSLQQEH